jgi:Beta-1,3-glucanase
MPARPDEPRSSIMPTRAPHRPFAALATAALLVAGCGSPSPGPTTYWPAPPAAPGAPAGFWDAPRIPQARNALTFVFLNRTNGRFADGEIYWRFQHEKDTALHSIAEQPTFDMPAYPSERMYFFVCGAANGYDGGCATAPDRSGYFDFIEFTIGSNPYAFHGNTTRVDAFGLKVAMRLVCPRLDAAVGESYASFAEDRGATFQRFVDAVPAEFKGLVKAAPAPYAPYRIVEPGAGGFNSGGAYQGYYASFVDAVWSANAIAISKPGANGSGLGSYPDLSAAIFRHVGATAGTFDANGKLLNRSLWQDPATFYTAAPADYYARFWHDNAIDGKAYGFPYDDVGGYSTYLSCDQPQFLLVAIGW